MKAAEIPQIRSLSITEKIALIEDLWSEVLRQPNRVPIPDWHVSELEKDFPAYRANPTEGAPWEEVKQRILRRK